MTMNYEGFDEMDFYTPNEIEAELEAEWENMWVEICDYANKLNLSPSYVEEEFYILGELHKPHTNPPVLNKKIADETERQAIEEYFNSKDKFYDDDNDNDNGFRFKPRPTSM